MSAISDLARYRVTILTTPGQVRNDDQLLVLHGRHNLQCGNEAGSVTSDRGQWRLHAVESDKDAGKR